MLKIKDHLEKYKALPAFPFCLSLTFENLSSQWADQFAGLFIVRRNEFLKEQRERSEKIYRLDFRYADWVDHLPMFLASIAAVGDNMSTNVLLVSASCLMNSLGYGKTPHKDTMSLTSWFI